MKWLQRAALWLCSGALLGSLLVLFLYPYYLSYNSPSVWNESACKWSECVEMSTLLLTRAQLLGASIGAVLAILAGEGWLWSLRRKLKQKQKAEASSS
jgi:hypothetical protein